MQLCQTQTPSKHKRTPRALSPGAEITTRGIENLTDRMQILHSSQVDCGVSSSFNYCSRTYWERYSRKRLYSVFKLMPNNSAARSRIPPH